MKNDDYIRNWFRSNEEVSDDPRCWACEWCGNWYDEFSETEYGVDYEYVENQKVCTNCTEPTDD